MLYAGQPPRLDRPRPPPYDATLPAWLGEILLILILLAVVAIVFARLPKVELGYDKRYEMRRRLNWLPLGLTNAFLYMGRYNLKISKFAFESLEGNDGFVYLGTAAMSFTYAAILPKEQLDGMGKIVGPATDPANWKAWPLSMVPLALLGLFLAWRIGNARPKSRVKAAH